MLLKLVKRHYHTPRNLLKLIERKGFVENNWPRERGRDIASYLEAKPRTVYAGFDPTARNLHVGNLMVLVGLLHAQRAGHQVIALIGGATARIGDPSGKSEERPVLPQKDLNRNVKGITENIKTVFSNYKEFLHKSDKDLKEPIFLNNADWYQDVNVIDFLSEYGKSFRLGKMIARDVVKKRLELTRSDPNGGMSLSEFMYQAFQAYDWLHLSRHHDCFVQFGGHDQNGNIAAGHDLIKRTSGEDAFGLLLPLITTDKGEKLGKSAGNAIWLDSRSTPPFAFYQYFIRLPDTVVEQMLYFFTFLPKSEIQDIMAVHEKSPEKRHAQIKLAKAVTILVHGEAGLDLATKATDILYAKADDAVAVSKKLSELSSLDLKNMFEGAAYVRKIFQPGTTLLNFAMSLGCFRNEKEADKIITAGGFYVNQMRRSNSDEILIPGDHILSNQLTLVRIGKKNYTVVEWTR